MGISLNGLNSGMQDMYSSLLGGSGDGASTLLSDYASIKNGSYGKMMKSYYAKINEEEEETASKSKSDKKERTARPPARQESCTRRHRA